MLEKCRVQPTTMGKERAIDIFRISQWFFCGLAGFRKGCEKHMMKLFGLKTGDSRLNWDRGSCRLIGDTGKAERHEVGGR